MTGFPQQCHPIVHLDRRALFPPLVRLGWVNEVMPRQDHGSRFGSERSRGGRAPVRTVLTVWRSK